ncbi:Crp/Fnr family transcriptional regulator [Alcaligenaceae bacterium A4P071]|nr:Crp/Fnr family transcriptional regulator [Alcaligenaceae bacterium B3P038]MDQ2148579.1 Crp/Fnr family transcriptional regulator [Alcaligenaceae bacterium C4P045]MDQ2185903.1 Crp/Fnr family transcriptional regulator [Alcaligenaceae bacterium A4P071]
MQLSDSLHLAAAWFRQLDADQRARVEQDIAVAHIGAGAIVERKGELAQAWIGVLSGLVKVSVANADGKQASLTGVPAGGWIGEGSLLKHEIRKYDVVALRDSAIARLPAATFEWLLDTSFPFNRYLLHQLNERVAQFIGKAENDRLLDADARVARCLAELFNPLLYPGMGMRLAITQEEVGYLARVSRQRANQALSTLESAGLLHVEYGAVRVLDIDGLKRYKGDEDAQHAEDKLAARKAAQTHSA